MTFVLLGILNAQATGAGPDYYFGTISKATSDVALQIATDSDGNFYLAGRSEISADTEHFIAKVNPSLEIEWQRTLSDANYNEFFGMAIDSSDNIYLAGASTNYLLVKYNSSGVLQFQKNVDGQGNGQNSRPTSTGLVMDSNEDLVLGGRASKDGGSVQMLLKYDNTGSFISKLTIQEDSTPLCVLQGLAVMPDDRFVALGWSTDAADIGRRDGCVVYVSNDLVTSKDDFGLSGTGATGDREEAYISVTDSSANTYVMIKSNTEGSHLAKFQSNSNTVFQKKITNAGTGLSMAKDSSDNIYSVHGNGYIFKYDSSGNFVWQRQITVSGFNVALRSIFIDSFNDIYIAGSENSSGADRIFFGKLPNDGSLTGSVDIGGTTFDYSASSETISTSSLTRFDNWASFAGGSETPSASSLSDATTSRTLTFGEVQ